MVSLGPYTESYEFRHMYVEPEKCKRNNVNSKKSSVYYGNSIMGFIDQSIDNKGEKAFSKFAALIKTANMEDQLSEMQANVTMFITPDEYLKFPIEFFINMDIGLARKIVNFSTLNRKIDFLLLSSSPHQQFITRYPANKLNTVTINNSTTIHGCTKILKSDINLNNGMIHVVNNLLVPDSMASYVYGP